MYKKGHKNSPEIIEKIRLANTGRKHSEETKEKFRQAQKEKVTPQEILRRRNFFKSIGRGKGYKQSKEEVEKRRENLKRLWADPVFRAKQLAIPRRTRKGVTLTPEHKEKLRIANTGRKHSIEAREKIKAKAAERKSLLPPKQSCVIEPVKCNNCNATFLPKHKSCKFCSKNCYREAAKKRKLGKTLYPHNIGRPSPMKGKKRPEISGSKHPQWRGGVTSERKLIAGTSEYKDWQKAVFKRDNYECQKCKKHGGILCAHHILNFATHEELRFEKDNGITMCSNCHNGFHKVYGNNDNTKEQLEEYLN